MRLRPLVAFLLIVGGVLLTAYGYRFYLVRHLREPVLAKLTDPDAALFRKERYVGPWTTGGILCGEVNPRNRAGGYTGYVRFESYDGKAVIDNAEMTAVLKDIEPCAYTDDSPVRWWWLRW